MNRGNMPPPNKGIKGRMRESGVFRHRGTSCRTHSRAVRGGGLSPCAGPIPPHLLTCSSSAILHLTHLHYCYSSRGKRTCMSPHETRPDSSVETPEECRDPCQHTRGILRFQPLLQMRTSALAVTAEVSGEAPCKSHGDWTFLRQHERVPDVLVIILEEP